MDPKQSRIAQVGPPPGEYSARDAAIQAVKDHPSTTFMAPYESLAVAVLAAAEPLIRVEALALATVLEFPRPGNAFPLQLRRSYLRGDWWAICDRTGRRWSREHGWVYEAQNLREEEHTDTRFTLAEAEPLARQLAASRQEDQS